MTTETKSEAEKIAQSIVKQHNIKCDCFSTHGGILRPHLEYCNLQIQTSITQALLDFREKDVRELVEALEKLNVRNKVYGFESDALQAFKIISYDDIAALVRKFKGGKL